MMQMGSDESLMGLRPGEVISCIHSQKSPYGCNNASSCSYCGALQAVLESSKKNEKVTNETRITSFLNDNLFSWDLSVTSVPLKIKDSQYYVVSMTDISSEKRKKQLERIFIHDLVNSAGGISGLFEALEMTDDEMAKKSIFDLLGKTSQNMLEQVLSYRQIFSAESGELEVKLTNEVTTELIKESIIIVSNNKSLPANIELDPLNETLELKTDKILLSRILINMIKNAVEADNDINSKISVGAKRVNGKIKFWIRNNTLIPTDIQEQIFQRSFSSKGANRGLGTYSMKLLGENYLKGKVDFISNNTDKTIFYIELADNATEES